MSSTDNDTPPVIRFTATIAQVRTMADGGLRFVFDVPETAIEAATALMQAKQGGAVLEVAAVAIRLTEVNDETKKGATGGTPELDKRRTDLRHHQ